MEERLMVSFIFPLGYSFFLLITIYFLENQYSGDDE